MDKCKKGHLLGENSLYTDKRGYTRCRACHKESLSKYRSNHGKNKTALSEARAKLNRNSRIRLKERAHEKLGNKCSNPNCLWINPDGTKGCVDSRCLQIDHVNDDGTSERKEKNYYHSKIYLRVLEDTEGRYQLLCANCNWIKRNNREFVRWDFR